ncbi:MAG: hypothetical protein WCY62_02170 [Clostridia bacterium]
MKRHIYSPTKQITNTVLLILVLLSQILSVSSASDQYARSFIQNVSDNMSIQALSPYKNKDGLEYWPLCTSKNNQPRNVSGTNPHQGTDLTINVGELIYPIYDGEIVYMDTDISSQTGYILVRSDIGIGEYAYIEYMHIVPISGLSVGQYVYTSIPIATIDDYLRYDSHLHIGRVNETRDIHFQIYDLFADCVNWTNGSDLDVFSYPSYNEETAEFSIYAYISSDTENPEFYGGYGRFRLKYITLFYSVNGNAWQHTDIADCDPNYKYTFNIQEKTNAVKGDTIEYYITGTRDNESSYDTSFNDASYTVAYYPAYYSHPDAVLSGEKADAIALTIKISK